MMKILLSSSVFWNHPVASFARGEGAQDDEAGINKQLLQFPERVLSSTNTLWREDLFKGTNRAESVAVGQGAINIENKVGHVACGREDITHPILEITPMLHFRVEAHKIRHASPTDFAGVSSLALFWGQHMDRNTSALRHPRTPPRRALDQLYFPKQFPECG